VAPDFKGVPEGIRTMNNVMVKIDGRDALPLRAIPYITFWRESPDSLARVLAAPKTKKICGKVMRLRHYKLFAYQADAGENYVQIPPEQWEQIVLELECLTQKLQKDERDGAEGENHADWRAAAVQKLPGDVFIWMDEFQSWYSSTRPHEIIDADNLSDPPTDDDVEQQHDRLYLTPLLPEEMESRLWRYPSQLSSAAQSKEDVLPARVATPDEDSADTDKLVAWQAATLESWGKIKIKHGQKPSARKVMSWLRADGQRDVFGCTQPNTRDSLVWLDRAGNPQTLTLHRLGTVISEWRKAGKISRKR
jgi:hypothetical protein